jgi:hypothetical protein
MNKLIMTGDRTPMSGPASNDLVRLDDNPEHLSRRVFIRSMTLGAAALAITACGGGGSLGSSGISSTSGDPLAGSGSQAGSGGPRAWAAVPTLTFTQGVAARISIDAYLSGTGVDSLTISKNSAVLPPGVTYDQASKSFVYDGIGAVGLTDGHILTVSEG